MQCVDREDMKRVSGPWTELFDSKADARLLASLKAQKWEPEACYSSLKEILNPLAQSLHFNSHSRWGLQIDSQEIRTLSLRFLAWMLKNNEWPALAASVRSSSAPASLRVRLSRCFVRFRSETGAKTRVEVEDSDSRILSQIGSAVLETFTVLSSKLPDPLRLPYQLHLEGLVDEEISALIGIDTFEVSQLINQAKKHLKEAPTWKQAS